MYYTGKWREDPATHFNWDMYYIPLNMVTLGYKKVSEFSQFSQSGVDWVELSGYSKIEGKS